MLMLSVDEREDEDLEGEAASMPFVVHEDLADQYGVNFFISLDENAMPKVSASN